MRNYLIATVVMASTFLGAQTLPPPFYEVRAYVDCSAPSISGSCSLVVANVGTLPEAKLIARQAAIEGFWIDNPKALDPIGTYYAPATVKRLTVRELHY